MVRLPRNDRVQGGHSGVRVHGVRRRALRAEDTMSTRYASRLVCVDKGGSVSSGDVSLAWLTYFSYDDACLRFSRVGLRLVRRVS